MTTQTLISLAVGQQHRRPHLDPDRGGGRAAPPAEVGGPGLAHFFTMWAFLVLLTVYIEAYGVHPLARRIHDKPRTTPFSATSPAPG